jgi:hypothetical protein
MLHTFEIIKQLYECINGCVWWKRRAATAADVKVAFEGKAEFSQYLPPLPVGTAPDQQQQLEHPRAPFAENPKQPVFERIILKGGIACHHTARSFWRKFDGGSAFAKSQKFIKSKGVSCCRTHRLCCCSR